MTPPDAGSTTQSPAPDDRSERHPYDYAWRADMDLRPPPPRSAVSPLWTGIRRRYVAPWIDWTEDPIETPATWLMTDHLWQGDELMDAVVEAFRTIGVGRGRRMLGQALDDGIDSVTNAPDELVTLFEQLDHPPAWHDPERWELGRCRWVDSSLSGKLAMALQDFMGTFVGEEVSTATGVTGRFVRDFARRERETLAFFYEVTRPGAVDRWSHEFRTIIRVRLMHAQARAGLRRSLGDDHFAHHGNPISNATTVGAAMTFGLLPLLFDHHHGRRATHDDLDLVTEYWGYIAHLMGAADELIPRNGHDALHVVDHMVAHAGGPTIYTDIAADAAIGAVERQPRHIATAVRLATPPLLGAMAHFTSPDLVRALVRSPGLDTVRLEPWRTLTGMLTRGNIVAKSLADGLPLRTRRQQLRSRNGDLFLAAAARRRPGFSDITSVESYTHHDTTPDTEPGCPIATP